MGESGPEVNSTTDIRHASRGQPQLARNSTRLRIASAIGGLPQSSNTHPADSSPASDGGVFTQTRNRGAKAQDPAERHLSPWSPQCRGNEERGQASSTARPRRSRACTGSQLGIAFVLKGKGFGFSIFGFEIIVDLGLVGVIIGQG